MNAPSQMPTEQDRKNYNYDIKSSPFYSKPHEFLRVGDKVRARIRIWDLPWQSEDDWGPVVAEATEEGVCVHVQNGCWPAVQFANRLSDVTDFEVEKI